MEWASVLWIEKTRRNEEMNRLRCAIYTRKSTEDGLDQEFNSLDAQREACEAYIESQKSEGWKLVKTRYDDGGLSGGTMNRPALEHLLEHVRAGKIDIIVVYKVDRLTRALADFAKIVEILDDQGASFVSVTQAFNTTTSMGRLTLNVLLSFAQFEREVTAERIRDKIAASRKKGLWMGGPVPLGYDVRDKKMQINAKEAETVRKLFKLYLDLDTVRDVKAEADRRGYRTKKQKYSTGRIVGGCPFTRGRLYHLLKNPLYIGRVKHKDTTYPGQHEGIIDQDLWENVQAKLEGRAWRNKNQPRSSNRPLLLSLLHDEEGDRLSTNHAVKNGRRYCYYISKHLNGKKREDHKGWRLPARQIEDVVFGGLWDFLDDPKRLMDATRDTCLTDDGIMPFAADGLTSQTAGVLSKDQLRDLIERVDLGSDQITIHIDMSKVLGLGGSSGKTERTPSGNISFPLILPIRLKRRGVEMKLIMASKNAPSTSGDHKLIALIAKAHVWFESLKSGNASSIEDIATAENVNASDVSRYLPLAFLAPDIVESILKGSQPTDLTVHRIKRLPALPLSWEDQRLQLGFKD
jgi:site-specific DNA recombinase